MTIGNCYSEYVVSKIDELPFGVNLVCLSLNDLAEFILTAPKGFLNRDALNFGIIFWELPNLPSVEAEIIQFLDGVVSVSEFVRQTLDNQLSNVFSFCANYPMVWPEGVVASRSRFNLPDDKVIFISSFDPYSDMERKNPIAVVDAFQAAFREAEPVNLLLKLNSCPEDFLGLKALRVRCAGDSRIRILVESMPYVDVLSLYASCDVFVSLHRAEGLGLGPMEAMILGKPTIATAWSGNTSFMNHLNSCPVRYKLVPPQGSVWVYRKEFLGKESVWADPNVEDASLWMSRLAGDENLRRSIGEKAKADMELYRQNAARGDVIDEILSVWRQKKLSPGSSHNRRTQWEKLRKSVWKQRSSYGKRVTMTLRDHVDRHISWRFKTQ
jgi:glycosyltransferase involved in cell wall biosynthesis